MAYDEPLADRIRGALAAREVDAVEKRMFGGIAFLVRGHMAVGVIDRELMVRVGPEAYVDALARPHARPMDFTGRPLSGYVYVGPKGNGTAKAVDAWLGRALAFVATLPVKTAKRKAARKRARRPSGP